MHIQLLIALLFLAMSSMKAADQGTPVREESKRVCLNMIVKNESPVIRRCLESVLPLIDYWVIVDTGSTDGTQDIIRAYMKEKNVPGELFERPWVHFGHNRNEALHLARGKADYLFFIDADEYLEYRPTFVKPLFDKDYYYGTLTSGGSTWKKIQLVNNHLQWNWEGVLHEVICPPAERSVGVLSDVVTIYTVDGARSRDSKKFDKDAEIFEAALKDDPTNSRYVFYLAQSYACANKPEPAIKNYEKRIAMSTTLGDSEVFWSYMQIARLRESLNAPQDVVVKAYLEAFSYNKQQAEPLYYLANYYRKRDDFRRSYEIALIARPIPVCDDILFMNQWICDWGVLLELSVSAYWIERYDECRRISLELLEKKSLPEHVRKCVEQNFGFANLKLVESIAEDCLTAELLNSKELQ